MTAVTETKSLLQGLGPNMETYLLEIPNGYTLETSFGKIISVQMTPEETQSTSRAWGYSVSGGQVTFSVSATATYSVTVIGLK